MRTVAGMLVPMKHVLRLALPFAAAFAACSGSVDVVGIYDLDKAAMREGVLASLPAEAKGKPEEVAKMEQYIESMSWSIELKKDGIAALTMKMRMENQPKEWSSPGTWKLDGDRLTIAASQNGVEEVHTAVFDGKSFVVDQKSPTGGSMKMTFRRR